MKIPLDYTPDAAVQNLIFFSETWDENDIFRVSKLKEPRLSDEEEEKLPTRFDGKTFAKITKSILSGKENVSTETASLTHRDWHLLLATALLRVYERNTVIVQQGIPNDSIYKIKAVITMKKVFLMYLQGRMRMERNETVEGRTTTNITDYLEPPQMFGEMAILGQTGTST